MTETGKYVITIGRQFGCGAREIGQLVAKSLSIYYYDKELLLEAAKHSGVAPEVFEASDERTPKFFSSLWSFNLGYYSGALFVGDAPIKDDNVYHAQSNVMRELAQRGPCVIVGRTADYILRDTAQVISVFLHSSIDDRIARIIARGDCDNEHDARDMALKKNKLRAGYYNFYTDKEWGTAESYDLCLDCSKLTHEQIAQTIINYLKMRI